MYSEFRCHTRAVRLYKQCKNIKLKAFMRDQLLRASSSVALNLSEGNARKGRKDRLRFFNIAYSSLQEVKSICELEDLDKIWREADQLGAMIFVLCRKLTETDN